MRADPPENAQLREPPKQLTLYFSEPLEHKFSDARVVNQAGTDLVDHIEFDASDNAAMHVFLKDVQAGYLSVNWETVSSVDGHRVSGSYPLTILNSDGSLPSGTPIQGTSSVSGTQANPFRVITKWLLLLAGSVLAGALAFVVFVTPGLSGGDQRTVRSTFEGVSIRVAAVALAVLVPAGLVELVVQAATIHTSIGQVVSSNWGQRWLLRNLILIQPALILAYLMFNTAFRRVLCLSALIGAVCYLAVTSSASHSAAGGGAFWAAASDFVHLLASSVWIGMLALLIALFVWLRRNAAPGERYAVLATSLKRFSAIAVLSVAALFFTGTLNAIIEVGTLGDLLNTSYGRVLLVKLLLLVPLFIIAAGNAYLARPDLEAAVENTGARNRMSLLADLEAQLNRRIRLEFLVAAAVLLVVGVLVQLTPTRGRLSTPEQGSGQLVRTAESGDIQATLTVSPNQPGQNTFEVYLAGRVDKVDSLRLEFINPNGSSGESRLDLDPSNPPTFYIGKGPYLSSAGTWNIILNIRVISGSNDIRMPFNVKVNQGASVTSTPRSGGSFAAPVSLGPQSAALLAAIAVLSLVIIVGSRSRPGMPEGYLGWVTEELAYRLAPLNVRPVWTLGIMVVTGIGLGLILGAHLHKPLTTQQARGNNPVPATAESIARGKMLFEQNCTICHGESGKGDGPAAASLSIPPANLYQHIPYHPDQFFFGVMSKGLAGVMPSFEGQISEDDRWNILNYLRATFTATPADR